MDFDIDAVLDQLEKTLNQSDHEEKDVNQNTQVFSTTRKSNDDLLLLDLDPFASNENQNHEDDNDDKIERIKQDLEDLYANSTVIENPEPLPITTNVLPDVISQQEDLASSLPLVVEQLEFEVRQEILQHTLEQSSSSSPVLLPDLTTIPNGNIEEKNDLVLLSTSIEQTETEEGEEEEQQQQQLAFIPMIENTEITNESIFQNEPDVIPHENQTPVILHSVDSIVNLAESSSALTLPLPSLVTTVDFEDYVTPNVPMNDIEPLQSSSELVFTACDDENNNDESIEHLSEEPPINESQIMSSLPITTASAPVAQDFDLVKNILSEIFDKRDDEILEEKQPDLTDVEPKEFSLSPSSPPSVPIPTNNEEDFRFLDDMLASIEVPDGDIHQLTPAEIDRVDSLLKDIVNAQQSEETFIPSINDQIESLQPSEQELQSIATALPTEEPMAAATAAVSTVPVDEELIRVEREWAKLTDEEKQLGSIAPEWISDDAAPACMKCALKFSLTRRRHHCRACGKVFCSSCCWQKIKLVHDDSKEDRACNDCVRTIQNVEYLWNYMRNNQKPRSSVLRKKTGNSSSETGATSLARQASEHKKSVTFDDGVKPGAEINTNATAAAAAVTNTVSPHRTRSNENDTDQISSFKAETLTTEELEERIQRLKNPNEPAVEFRIHNNLTVISKITDNFDCYLSRQNNGQCWIFSTRGLCTVAQDELVFIFDDNLTHANEIISDLLAHIHQIYLDATKGSFIRHLGISLASSSNSFLGTTTNAGFLFLSDPTAIHSLFPDAPYLFGILIHRLELPTAQCFPLRLLVRLGYEYQSYPWVLFNVLNRAAMFTDTQNTIMSLLCDFRSYTYILPIIRGLIISIGVQGSVSIRIPRNRHDDMLKALEQSSPHALSFGIMNVNRQIHSKRLATIQNNDNQQYETRIFSSLDVNSDQLMIGGNFVVINASLRSRDSPSSSPLDTPVAGGGSFSSNNNNLNAKVNTIEDGIMLQIDGDALKVLKQCLKERKDYAILAKARAIMTDEQKDSIDGNTIKRNSSEQLVEFLWVDDDNDINQGIHSPIDNFPMNGIRNSRIHYAGQRSPQFRLRWTDLFFLECYLNNNESFDPTRLADSLAKAFIQALTPYLDMLIEAKYRKLGLRVTIDRDNASYIAGSNGEQLPAFFLSQLDDHMIPIVMRASDNVSRSAPTLVLELIFYLLD